MNPRTRSRMPASIGSNQASPANSAGPSACVLVLSCSMAWSPPALERRKWLVEQARDYAPNPFPPHPRRHLVKLQTSLQTTAKAEPAFRFYALWDKVCRTDVLQEAYRRCRANAGVAGGAGETFGQIDFTGQEGWLETLREELTSERYVPKPLLRVWIPKSNGGQRPLGIPTIKDRVVQMAVVLIIGALFEADLLPQQYGFRPGLDAKMALRRVYWHVTQHGRREAVDADLRDYFTSIPHSDLMRSLARRIADGRMLRIIKCWLTAPVVEYVGGRPVRTTEARRTKRGTPQGSPISPLMANCYFRRF